MPEHPQARGDFAVELRGITKTFPGVIANRHVSLAVRPGTIHAIVGENGAGKSTLMKTLYGMHQPDEGSITVDGVTSVFRSPTDAIEAGIGMVHQHFMLADNLTITENIILGNEPVTSRGRIDFVAANTRINALMTMLGVDFDLDAPVSSLGVGQRQRVEILKVLFRGARILILDEPTAVLVPQEVSELFVILKRLVREGSTVIFISHKLDEVLENCDEITVIRQGTTVAHTSPRETSRRGLAELMVGGDLPDPSGRDTHIRDSVLLDVDRIDVAGATIGSKLALDQVSLRVRSGEIVGIAGVEGNGQFELCEAILGLIATDHGSVSLEGRDITHTPTRERINSGLSYIPFDRHREGLLLDAPLWENTFLGREDDRQLSSVLFTRRRAIEADSRAVIERFGVRTPSEQAPAFALSGGNQQKLVVGREMASDPKILLAAHPTRGVDVGAQAAIWEELRNARDNGMGVLLISADLEELIGLSDTILVMFDGRITAHLDPTEATPELLGTYMTGEVQEVDS
ncbi:MAG: ABC transporter ATP-binding protein [Actinobacteria bacterium]|nr:ABC transporter ATP-binding protein [Actinomycetota bacterium]